MRACVRERERVRVRETERASKREGGGQMNGLWQQLSPCLAFKLAQTAAVPRCLAVPHCLSPAVLLVHISSDPDKYQTFLKIVEVAPTVLRATRQG